MNQRRQITKYKNMGSYKGISLEKRMRYFKQHLLESLRQRKEGLVKKFKW